MDKVELRGFKADAFLGRTVAVHHEDVSGLINPAPCVAYAHRSASSHQFL